jgi:hypothetical protein
MDLLIHLNKMCSNSRNYGSISIMGQYLAHSDTIYFPFLQRHYYGQDTPEWFRVCLGDMTSDISQAVWDFNFEAASILLTQWISRYDTNNTHPHNKPNLMYYGLPKYIKDQEKSSAYLAAIPHSTDGCGVPAAIGKLDHNKRDYAIINDTTCDDINCQLKDSCKYYINVLNADQERIDNLMKIIDHGNVPYDGLYDLLFVHINSKGNGLLNLTNDILAEEDQSIRIAAEADNDTCPHGNDWESNCEGCRLESEYEGTIEDLTDEERTMRWVEQQITRARRNDE